MSGIDEYGEVLLILEVRYLDLLNCINFSRVFHLIIGWVLD